MSVDRPGEGEKPRGGHDDGAHGGVARTERVRPEAATARLAAGPDMMSASEPEGRTAIEHTSAEMQELAERYHDLGRIASGGMGDVRRVRDRAMARVLAMKVLHWEFVDSPRERARFLNEARMTAMLQHPGIVPVHDQGVLSDGRPWFTMQEVRGRTFGHAIAELHRGEAAAMPLTRLCEALLRACEAVAYAHSRAIIHRDIKPDNLMLGEFGEVLVMDWGLARYVNSQAGPDYDARTDGARDQGEDIDDNGDHGKRAAHPALTEAGQIVGTLAYMAPEQAQGATDLGPAADVYALGTVLYQLMTGKPPYTGSARAVWAALLSGPPVPVADIPARFERPADLQAICARAMARAPGQRFAHAGELARALQDWLGGTRRRNKALAIVARADAMAPRIDDIRTRATELRSHANAILDDIRPYDPVESKWPGWELEDKAVILEREAAVQEVTWLQTLRSALEEMSDLAEAHDRLADHYRARVQAAEAARDPHQAVRYEALLKTHDRGRHAAFVAGQGALTVVTRPPGAQVSLYRYVERRRRLVPEHVRDLGATPIFELAVSRGSYLVRIRAAGRAEVLYPVHIERGAHWDGVRPGQDCPHAVYLPRAGDIGDSEVYMPAGWYLSGGDSHAGESLPRRWLWLDARVIHKHPVTNSEYLAFLNDLVAGGREREALRAMPDMPISMSQKSNRTDVFRRDKNGLFVLAGGAQTPEQPDWPVSWVSWHDAMAYAAWYADTSGQAWRLPNELEWEKAARGCDGRFMPWGDHVEPTWAGILDSHAGTPGRLPIHDYPDDASPYGVRGMVGNVRDWCINTWERDGPLVNNDIVQVDAAAPDDTSLRAVRGGAWVSTTTLCRPAMRFATKADRRANVLGFRLLRPLAPGTEDR